MVSTTRQVGEAGVGDLPVDQQARDHADRLTARGQDRVGHGAHEPDLSAAVDEPESPGDERLTERGGRFDVGWQPAGAGSTEDEHATHHPERIRPGPRLKWKRMPR
jgi:hypothetical protein